MSNNNGHFNDVPPTHNIIFIIALMAIPLSGICIDLYTPSLPAMMAFFNTKESLIQMTIPAYLAGFGFFQLIAGPLVDTFGRRYPLIFALSLNILIAISIPHLNNIYYVLVGRMLQGISVATSSVAARSIIIDLYSHSKSLFLKRMSLSAIAWGLGPILAPGIGGIIQQYFNWEMNFYIMAIYIFIITIGAMIFVKETHQYKQIFNLSSIVRTYSYLLKNKVFLGYTLSCGPLWGCLTLFAIIAPFLIQKELGLSAIHFGNLALTLGVAWLCGSIFCRSYFGKHENSTFYIVFIIAFFFSFIMILLGSIQYLNFWVFAACCMILSFSASFIFTHHFTQALNIFPKEIGGSANALLSSLTSLTITVISIMASLQPVNSTLPLGIDYFLIFTVVALFYILFLKKE